MYVQTALLDSHDEQLKLAEFTLGTISTAVHMFSDSSMKASLKLAECLLDDKRKRANMITSRSEVMNKYMYSVLQTDMQDQPYPNTSLYLYKSVFMCPCL